jgi:hypothetical protein
MRISFGIDEDEQRKLKYEDWIKIVVEHLNLNLAEFRHIIVGKHKFMEPMKHEIHKQYWVTNFNAPNKHQKIGIESIITDLASKDKEYMMREMDKINFFLKNAILKKHLVEIPLDFQKHLEVLQHICRYYFKPNNQIEQILRNKGLFFEIFPEYVCCDHGEHYPYTECPKCKEEEE